MLLLKTSNKTYRFVSHGDIQRLFSENGEEIYIDYETGELFFFDIIRRKIFLHSPIDNSKIVVLKDPNRIISKQDRYDVLRRQGWRCNICGCNLKYSNRSEWEGGVAHIDHIHPFADRCTYVNGPLKINELSNLQALCKSCNLLKGRTKS